MRVRGRKTFKKEFGRNSVKPPPVPPPFQEVGYWRGEVRPADERLHLRRDPK